MAPFKKAGRKSSLRGSSSRFGSDHWEDLLGEPVAERHQNSHKPICKELADKKVGSYIQLEDVKDKSFLNKNAFPSLHAKKVCKQGTVNCCSKFGC